MQYLMTSLIELVSLSPYLVIVLSGISHCTIVAEYIHVQDNILLVAVLVPNGCYSFQHITNFIGCRKHDLIRMPNIDSTNLIGYRIKTS